MYKTVIDAIKPYLIPHNFITISMYKDTPIAGVLFNTKPLVYLFAELIYTPTQKFYVTIYQQII